MLLTSRTTPSYLILLLSPSVLSLLILPSTPLAGFNTFDNYDYTTLNSSSLMNLSILFANSPLSRYNYESFVLDGGWSAWSNGTQYLDSYGLPAPAPDRFPNGFSEISTYLKQANFRFGLWHIRGIHISAAAMKLPVKGMEEYTLDQLVDVESVGGGKNGSCLWAPEWLGVNASHPAAQSYYDAVVDKLIELGADFIKADCFFCRPCYNDEMLLFTNAVKRREESLVLYYSPGGGALIDDGQWAASNQIASMYRSITDLDNAEWYDWGGIQQLFFIAGNFTLSKLHGANGTWADLDMLPINKDWWTQGDPIERADRGQTIFSLWMIGQYPLFYSGIFPVDTLTFSYMTNPLALSLNRRSQNASSYFPTRVLYEGNCTCLGEPGSCTIPHGPNDHPLHPCVTKWVSSFVGDSSTAFGVMIANIGEDIAYSIITSFVDLGLTMSSQYAVSDIWTGSEIGVYTTSFNISLRPHASMLLLLSSIE
jgi:alpha-galactosidase